MSKFFDETRRAQDWASREGAAQNLDVGRMLDTIKDAGAVAVDLADARLRRCRKIRLACSPETRVISGQSEFGEVAVESYRALRTRLMRSQAMNGLRSVVLSSAIGGEGKTLTAMNLAFCCAQLSDMRVLLIDADLRTHGLTRLLGHPPAPALAEILTGQAQPEEAILATDLPNLYVLGGGAAAAPPPELFAGGRWKDFVGWCGETFRLILVDAPPILPLADYELIATACDAVLVVVRALSTQRELLQKAAGQIDAKKLLGLVFNATDINGEYHYSYRYYGHPSRK